MVKKLTLYSYSTQGSIVLFSSSSVVLHCTLQYKNSTLRFFVFFKVDKSSCIFANVIHTKNPSKMILLFRFCYFTMIGRCTMMVQQQRSG